VQSRRVPNFDHLKKWWGAHATVIASILLFLDPSIEHYAAQHPTGTVGAILLLIVAAVKARITPPAATPDDVSQAISTTQPPAANTSIPISKAKP